MAKSVVKDPKPALNPEKMFQTVTDVQTAGLGSLAWLGTKWVETMSDVGAEWLSFVAERVKQDVKTQHELLHAKSFEHVRTIQAQFLQQAMDDYRNETGKIVEFCSNTMAEIREKAKSAQKDKKP